jgi:hypothetical protein
MHNAVIFILFRCLVKTSNKLEACIRPFQSKQLQYSIRELQTRRFAHRRSKDSLKWLGHKKSLAPLPFMHVRARRNSELFV